MNLEQAIQNELVGRARDFLFPVMHVLPAAVGGKLCLKEEKVKCQTAQAWPESATFGDPVRNRRNALRRERLTWTWRLQIKFNTQVALEPFEQSLLTNYPLVKRDPENGIDQQISFLLEDVEVQTPVTQQPAQGTVATYRFSAILSPT